MLASRRPRRSRGSMLIVALGVLTLLSLMAVTFVTLMRLERSASANYVDGTKAKLTAEAGLQRFIADLNTIAKEPVFDSTGRLKKFVFGVVQTGPGAGKEIDVGKRVEDVDPQAAGGADQFFYGKIGASYSKGADEYRIKVVDTSALFDLNFPMDMDVASGAAGGPLKPLKGQVLEQMLDELGVQIKKYRQSNNLPFWNPLASATDTDTDPQSHQKPIHFAGKVGAEALLLYRSTLDGRKFQSKSQLQEIMEESSYTLLADFVTAHGSTDEFSVRPEDSGTVGGGFGPTAGHSLVKITDVPRALVNINLASRPVLVSMLTPIAGRRHAFHVVGPSTQAMEASDPDAKANYAKGAGTSASFPEDQKEDLTCDVREGWIYVGPIGEANAEKLADWIIAQRPFYGYGDLYGRIMEDMKGPQVLAASLPPAALNGSGTPITTPGVRIFPSADPRYNISGIVSEAYYPALVREAGYSLLLANFNPAMTSNSTVPNTAGFLPVDKGGLLFPVQKSITDNTGATVDSRQTFEVCYDTRGVFEVTSLGQLKKANGELIAQEKMLTVVRLLGQITHRSQNAFERNDYTYSGAGASGNQRSGVTTRPDRRRNWAPLQPDAPPQGDEANDSFSKAFGHVEMDVASVFDSGTGPGDVKNRLPAFCTIAGTPLLAALFEWHEKGAGNEQSRAYHAVLANGQPGGGGSYYTAAGPTPRSLFLNRALGPMFQWKLPNTIESGSRPVLESSFNVGAGGAANLYPDGVHMSYRSGRDFPLWYRASANCEEEYAPGSTPSETDVCHAQGAQPIESEPEASGWQGTPTEGPGIAQRGNIWYRKGAIEFWYKPEFNWSYNDAAGAVKPFPLYCGYVGASRVFYNPGVRAQQYGNTAIDASIKGWADDPRGTPTDGTQLYVFRNSEGQLRATRLYFRVVGQQDPMNHTLAESTEAPVRFVDPVAGDNFGEQTHAQYPGKSFVGGDLEPGAAGTGTGGAIETYRRAVERLPYDETDPNAPKGYPWPPLELSEYQANRSPLYMTSEEARNGNNGIRFARVDAYVPYDSLKTWRAGEWHHIAISWDDTGAGTDEPLKFLKISVDGRGDLCAAKIIGEKNMFVRLNEPPHIKEDELGNATASGMETRYPKDRITVGCVVRRLAKTEQGVFKHKNVFRPSYLGSSATAGTGTGTGGGTSGADERRVNLYACGVIDDFITYDADGGRTQAPQRYENTARYVNHFDLTSRMPTGGRSLEVARLSWTCLLPGTTHGSGAAAGTAGNAGSIEVSIEGQPTVKLRDPNVASGGGGGPGSNSILYTEMARKYSYAKLEKGTTTDPGEVTAANAKVRYEVKFTPASYGAGTSSGAMNYVDTPILQEVSLMYFLPSPQTLLKERVVD